MLAFFFLKKYLICTRVNLRVGSRFGSLFLFFFGLCLQGMSEISSGLKAVCAAGRGGVGLSRKPKNRA